MLHYVGADFLYLVSFPLTASVRGNRVQAAKELKLSCYKKETLLYTIYPNYGSLI